MKSVVTFFFLLITLSNAFHLETPLFQDLTRVGLDSKPYHHHDGSDVTSPRSSSSSNGGEEPKILLPNQKPAEQVEEIKKMPAFTDLDLRWMVNRSPIHLKTRFPFPGLRFFPHRCHHHERFFHKPGRLNGVKQNNDVDLMLKKMRLDDRIGGGAYASILQHRHVARGHKFDPQGDDHHDGDIDQGLGMVLDELKKNRPHSHVFLIPSKRHYRHHPHHDDQDVGKDRRVVIKGEKNDEKHNHKHHDDQESKYEETKNDVLKKIRKFLVHF